MRKWSEAVDRAIAAQEKEEYENALSENNAKE